MDRQLKIRARGPFLELVLLVSSFLVLPGNCSVIIGPPPPPPPPPPDFTVSVSVFPTNAGAVLMYHAPGFYSNEVARLIVSGQYGYTFYDWTMDGVEISKSPAFSFVVTNSCTVVGNFRRYFTNTTRYIGVFARSNSLGNFLGLFDLTCDPSGSFSGVVRANNRRSSFSGNFRTVADGFVTTIYCNQFWFDLQYSWSTGGFTSTFKHTMDDISDTAPFLLEPMRHSYSTNPVPETGAYTAAFLDEAYASPNAGAGYSTMTVQPIGSVHVVGTTADNKKFSAGTGISETGRCPFLAPINAGRSGVAGWVKLGANLPQPSGQVVCGRESRRGQQDGFFVTLPVISSAYTPRNSPEPLIDFADGALTLEGGGYENPVSEQTSFTSYNVVKIANGDSGTIVISPKTGVFRGQFKEHDFGKISLNGVVLQDLGVGLGCFRRDGRNGSVRLGD